MKKILFIFTFLLTTINTWADTTETLGGYTFTIETDDEGDYYKVDCIDALNAIAHYVNVNTNTCSGKRFKMTTDISFSPSSEWNNTSSDENNFTAIGGESIHFKGTFDGQNHTISGIRIYQGSSNYQGLFGYVDNDGTDRGTVKNVILTNTRITGEDYTGGIAGYNKGTIENCHVTSTVNIHDKDVTGAYSHGGIVGMNSGFGGSSNRGFISNCTSAVTLSTSTELGEYNGGIAGTNDSYGCLNNNLALGVIIQSPYKYYGAIVGTNNNNENLSNNYYSNCTVGGSTSNIGAGGESCSADISDNKAVPALRDAASNSTAIGLLANIPAAVGTYSVTLSGRTLYKDDNWNTLCLPFDMTADQVTAQLGPSSLMTLSSTSYNNGELTLNFNDATTIEAGKPYIIKWASAENYVNPVFTGVTVSSATANVSTTYVDFIGCTSPVAFEAYDRTKLFLNEGNTLYYPNAAMTINAFRAYFVLKNIEAGDTDTSTGSTVRSINLNFGDGETTKIDAQPIFNVQSSMSNVQSSWYSLDGRKLSDKPAAKGVYINNGRKVVIN